MLEKGRGIDSRVKLVASFESVNRYETSIETKRRM